MSAKARSDRPAPDDGRGSETMACRDGVAPVQASERASGLLIVNADDLGGNAVATDRIIASFEAGLITSATAMMFMADSARAAGLARQVKLPVGLHLNLTQAYDSPEVSEVIAGHQQRVVRFMANRSRRRLGLAPHLLFSMRRVIADQLREFRALYGSEPTHLDGHNHAHLNPTALLCLPAGRAVRPAFEYGRPVGHVLAPRVLRDSMLARRHPTVDHFFPLPRIHPDLGGTGIERAFGLALSDSVEIMVHPDHDATFDILVGAAWKEMLSGYRLGTYRDLPNVDSKRVLTPTRTATP